MNAGPWGPWSGGDSSDQNSKNGGKDNQPKNPPRPENKGEKDSTKTNPQKKSLEDFVKKSEEKFKKIFGENFQNSGGGSGGGNKDDKNFNFKNLASQNSLIGLIVLAFTLLWLATGIYKVNSDENAVTLYFGKFYSISTPGLNYHIPYPFGEVIKRSVTAVNTDEFGFSSGQKKSEKRNFEAESLMLTGDENIVDIEFQIQWQIADIKDFVFNIAEQNQTIRKASEAAMREIIARTPIASALSDGKKEVEKSTKDLLQEILDSYGAGVRVVLVQLLRVDPPSQVINAFRDVQTAKADKEKEINEAQSYANDIIPRARGEAAQMKEQAEAYSKEVVSRAEGEAGKFLSVYNQYAKSKQVTKRRIYVETMEKIYSNSDKVFIDKSAARSGVTPYFPLNDLKETKKSN